MEQSQMQHVTEMTLETRRTKLSRDVKDAEVYWEDKFVKQNLMVGASQFVNWLNALKIQVSEVDSVQVLHNTKRLLEIIH